MSKRGKYSAPDSAWCEICDGHHGPGQHPEPVPSAEPQMPEGWRYSPQYEVFHGPDLVVSLKLIRALLAARGLGIAGPEERAVLEGFSRVRIDRIDGNYYVRESDWNEVCEAELACRAAKGTKL